MKFSSTLKLLMLVCLLLAGVCFSAKRASAADLGLTKTANEMVFSIPYANVPEVNALFLDSGTRVALVLPRTGLKVKVGRQNLDDEWITAFGIEKIGDELRWYLEKRDPALKVKSFLVLERKQEVLQVILLKPYRTWHAGSSPSSVPAGSLDEVQTGEQVKLDRLNKLLDKSRSSGAEKNSNKNIEVDSDKSPSLMASALRSFMALIFLVLIIVGLSFMFKRYRKKGGHFRGAKLVKVLGAEVVSGKHQVMLLELLGEVLVVGICGERMTLLTTISDPDRVEELRLLQENPRAKSGSKPFAGYLRGFLEKESLIKEGDIKESEIENLLPVEKSNARVTYEPAAGGRMNRAAVQKTPEREDLPDNYQEVVSQIKNRLKKNDRG